MINILFVCTGNICRSPIAEATFARLAEEHKVSQLFRCDSAATHAYHIGDLPDYRTRQNAEKHGITLTHRARKLIGQDFASFDYIVAMDEGHLRHIQNLHHKTCGFVPNDETVFLLREFDPQGGDFNVADPYYEENEAFEEVYQTVLRCNQQLLAYLLSKHSSKK
ncbi:MAG: low molecular weight protein-tyrosine-phosphatase [Spirosomataceae bacterium]